MIATSPDSASSLSSHESQPQFDASRNNRGGRSYNTRGGGRSGGRSRVQSQICSKIGHNAKVCYYMLSVQKPNPNQWHNPVIAQQPPSNFGNLAALHSSTIIFKPVPCTLIYSTLECVTP